MRVMLGIGICENEYAMAKYYPTLYTVKRRYIYTNEKLHISTRINTYYVVLCVSENPFKGKLHDRLEIAGL